MDAGKRDADELSPRLVQAARDCDAFLTLHCPAAHAVLEPALPLTDARLEAFRDACTSSGSFSEWEATLVGDIFTSSASRVQGGVRSVVLTGVPVDSACFTVARIDDAATPAPGADDDVAAIVHAMREKRWLRSRYDMREESDMHRVALAARAHLLAARLADMPQQLVYCLSVDPSGFPVQAEEQQAPPSWSVVTGYCSDGRFGDVLLCTITRTRVVRDPAGHRLALVARACLQLLLSRSDDAIALLPIAPIFTLHVESSADVTASAAAVVDAPAMYAPPPATSLIAVGESLLGCLGLQGTVSTQRPCLVPSPRVLGRWVIQQVACCATHCAVVTTQGSLYTWGSGSSGALGLGSSDSFAQPQLVEYFGLLHPLRVTCVTVGADTDCSHTAVVACGYVTDETSSGSGAVPADVAARGVAVADAGRVFVMGGGPATCQAASDAIVRTPQLLHAPRGDMYDPLHGGVSQVAAGGGFCIARTQDGAMYAWGRYEDGRLGVGVLQTLQQRRSRAAPAPKAVLQPMRITAGITGRDGASVDGSRLYTIPMRTVTCGQKHAVAVDVHGVAWTWGAHPALTNASTPAYEPQRVSCVSSAVTHATVSERGTMLVTADGTASVIQPAPHHVMHLRLNAKPAAGAQRNQQLVTGALSDTDVLLVSSDGLVYTSPLGAPADGHSQPTLLIFDGPSSLTAHVCTAVVCSGTVSLFTSAGLRSSTSLAQWAPLVLQRPESDEASLSQHQRIAALTSDADVLVDSRIVPAHACILAAAAPGLRAQLVDHAATGTRASVELFDVSLSAGIAFLLWCYGAVDMRLAGVDDSTVVELSAVATRLGMDSLLSACTEYLMCPARMWRDALERGDEPAMTEAATSAPEEKDNMPITDTILEGFRQLYTDDALCDVLLMCDDGSVSAHSCVVAAQSSVLADMIDDSLQTAGASVYLACSVACARRMLRFAYTADASPPESGGSGDAATIVEDLELASKLNMHLWKELLQSCADLHASVSAAQYTSEPADMRQQRTWASLRSLRLYLFAIKPSPHTFPILHARCRHSLTALAREVHVLADKEKLVGDLHAMLTMMPETGDDESQRTCGFACACAAGTPCRWVTAATARAGARTAAAGEAQVMSKRPEPASAWRTRALSILVKAVPLHVIVLAAVCVSALIAIHSFGMANTPAVPVLNACVAAAVLLLMFTTSNDGGDEG